jgi:hypothetical protein
MARYGIGELGSTGETHAASGGCIILGLHA